jgi:hypothetical protein
MAVQLVSFTNGVWGIASEELGINCSKFSVTVSPEINEWIPGINGQARGKVVGDPQGELDIEGETLDITTVSSLFVHNFYTAFVPVNSTTYFGRSAGGFYRDTATVDNERNGLKKVTAKYSSRFAVA